MRVHLTHLGCKLNQAELEAIARRFVAAGHRIVGSLDEADLHVVNSCTVTSSAARDSRKAGRRAARHPGRIRTVLTGCWVESDPDEAARLAGVDLVVPNADKDRLVELVHQAIPSARPASHGVPVSFVPLEYGHARALVKIEDGCNMRCAFCIIPRTRGRQRSRPVAGVVAEVRGLAEAGHPEVVVTGVQISAYRSGSTRLADLVTLLLDETPVRRLRLTSIAPWDFDTRLLDLFSTGRLCRHIHLSLQSGATPTLRRMRRPYTADHFAGLVDRIRRAVPAVAITTDVIVGFPGETGSEFAESLAFVEAMGFARVHAFPYSPRPGTGAARLDHPVAPETIRERMASLRAVGDAAARRFADARLGEEADVLWESRRGDVWLGTTDHYVRVARRSGESLERRLERVRLGPPECPDAPLGATALVSSVIPANAGIQSSRRGRSRESVSGPRPSPG